MQAKTMLNSYHSMWIPNIKPIYGSFTIPFIYDKHVSRCLTLHWRLAAATEDDKAFDFTDAISGTHASERAQ